MSKLDLKATNKVTFYLNRMAARGFDSVQVLEGTGLTVDQVDSDLFRPNPDQYRRIVLNIKQLTQDATIGIALGAEFKISNLGVLGYAALSSSNLAQSRELFSKYEALNEHIVIPASSIHDGKWTTELKESFPLGDLVSFAVEEFVSRTIELASSLTNRPFPVLEMRLTYAPPEQMQAYQSRFDCPMFFNQPRNLIVWDVARLDDPISLANEEVFKLCEQQCQALISKLADGDQLSSKIRNLLVENPGEFPTLEQMAQRLKMSSRTLRRRLVKEELTYQQILDQTRKDLAIQYLEYTSLTPKEIGYLLGYSSVSNFRRAFKGWTGKKLTDFRQNG